VQLKLKRRYKIFESVLLHSTTVALKRNPGTARNGDVIDCGRLSFLFEQTKNKTSLKVLHSIKVFITFSISKPDYLYHPSCHQKKYLKKPPPNWGVFPFLLSV
jgi:hypothetical protein